MNMRTSYTSILAFIILTIVSGCNVENQKNESFLNVKIKTIKDEFGACDGDGACGKIEIEYPVFSDNNKNIDEKLNSEITKTISSFYNVNSVEETSKTFIDDFKNYVNEFPEASNNKWNISMKYKVSNNTKKLLSLSFLMEGYTGGAHGFNNIIYTNYNPSTGETLKLADLISDVDKLTSIARETFVDDNNLDPNKSLNTQGFWFINDTFKLNNNFKVSDQGISFHYNQYEIAPYSQGPIEINIPTSKLEGLMK